MSHLSILRRASMTVIAGLTIALGACTDAGTAPDETSRFTPRNGLLIVDPPAPGPELPPPTQPQLIPVFVIGDGVPHAVGNRVNFWGSQWKHHNQMTGSVGHGAAAFKGYITQSDLSCGGGWVSNHGWHPPTVIAKTIAVIVTSSLHKQGSDFSGDIKKIVTVDQDGSYGPNAGHDGNGVVTGVVCTRP